MKRGNKATNGLALLCLPLLTTFVFILILNTSLCYEYKQPGKASFKYLYKPVYQRHESVHPNWWKRSQPSQNDGAWSNAEVVPQMEGIASPQYYDDGDDSLFLVTSNACGPTQFWHSRGQRCVPLQCPGGPGTRNPETGECKHSIPQWIYDYVSANPEVLLELRKNKAEKVGDNKGHAQK